MADEERKRDTRTYVKVHDGLPEHPKFLAVGGDAGWLWLCGDCYCSRQTTDGRIPKALVPRLSDRADPMALAARLVDVGLWIDRGDHYEMHDYLEHNRSAAEIKELRAKRSAAGSRGGRARVANEAKRKQEPELPLKQVPEQSSSHGQKQTASSVSVSDNSPSILKPPSVVGLAEPSTLGDDDPDAQPDRPPRASRDDRLRRAEAACDLLADQAHADAVARGVVLRPEAHRKACHTSARVDYLGQAQLIAHEHPDASPEDIAGQLKLSTGRPPLVDKPEVMAADLYRTNDEIRRAREADAPAAADWQQNRDRIAALKAARIQEDPDHAS